MSKSKTIHDSVPACTRYEITRMAGSMRERASYAPLLLSQPQSARRRRSGLTYARSIADTVIFTGTIPSYEQEFLNSILRPDSTQPPLIDTLRESERLLANERDAWAREYSDASTALHAYELDEASGDTISPERMRAARERYEAAYRGFDAALNRLTNVRNQLRDYEEGNI